MVLNTVHEVDWRFSLTKAPEIEIRVTKYLYESLKAAGYEIQTISKNCMGQRKITLRKVDKND